MTWSHPQSWAWVEKKLIVSRIVKERNSGSGLVITGWLGVKSQKNSGQVIEMTTAPSGVTKVRHLSGKEI